MHILIRSCRPVGVGWGEPGNAEAIEPQSGGDPDARSYGLLNDRVVFVRLDFVGMDQAQRNVHLRLAHMLRNLWDFAERP